LDYQEEKRGDAMIRKLGLGVAALVAILGLALAPARAEMHISGELRGHWQPALNPWYIDGNVTLGRSDSLLIDPAVDIRVTGNFRMTIEGKLWALGTQADSIKITATGGAPSSWYGITITGAAANRSHLKYVIIKHASQGVNCESADPTIENCSISLCNSAGVRFSDSNGLLLNSKISFITSNGVAITDQSRVTVQYCHIWRCGDSGVAISGSAIATVLSDTIEDVSDYGIALTAAGASTLLSWNVIMRPGVRGISVSESNHITVTRNAVYQTSSGAGVFIYRSTYVILVNNTILASGGNGGYGVQITTSSAQVENNIIGENSRNGLFVSNSAPACGYNDLYSNAGGDYSGVDPAQGDMHVNPMLINPGLGDFAPRRDSPIVDHGDPQLDPDPDGTQADIGAWFYNQNHPPVIQSWSPDSLIRVAGDSIINFTVTATDADHHQLNNNWYVNGSLESRLAGLSRSFTQDGDYTVRVVVDDHYYLGTAEHIWQFAVAGAFVRPDQPLPEGYSVSEVYPNPFNGTPRIDIALPVNGLASMEVWDDGGRLVRQVFSGNMGAGNHSLSLSVEDLAAGHYILAVRMGNGRALRSLVHLK
jgi:hypothetical protein